MSTPNPTHIIADAIAAAALSAPGAVAEHVVSKLTDAGYSIVPSEWLTKLSALLKASIDGLVDAGVWPDDWFAYVRTESCRIDLDRENPRIELTITPIWEPNPLHPAEFQMQPGGTTR